MDRILYTDDNAPYHFGASRITQRQPARKRSRLLTLAGLLVLVDAALIAVSFL